MDDHRDFFSAATALAAVKDLDVDAMRLLFKVERSGEKFYEGIADRIGNPRAADLLRRNGREERGHAERVRRALGVKLGQPWEPAADDLALYPIPLPDEIPATLLPVIVKAELDGDAGYQHWADRESDPEVQRLLRQNGREETVHGQRVTAVIALLDGKSPSA
jgi:rubrerythrin